MINLKTILLSTILVLAGIIVVSEKIVNAPRVADHENGMIQADHSDFKVVL